ncbi:N-6 DNA methylase [Aequorivita sp. F47161]|uniref:site-specific DNA-methyltransferase (adenine-specific) n=1 Tax=Aequorivita vitellina TaxID=2874475 RepID=A0A9X1QT79_9FLAO|nr:TaqI-like C-terminal specificity domain-containing protein [Aequorivita vitellina]MCG2417945.1 N-6 DNA methylase [Aequorivita vitellina]
MPLFQTTVVTKYLKTQDSIKLAEKWELYKSHFLNPIIQENIRSSKEEQYQEGFLRDLFVKILGYTLNPEHNFNLTTELKNVKDSKKADGGIIIKDKVTGVIELKGTNTTDLGKVEEQAFGYKNNQSGCIYVITSNFEKLRFYIDNAIEHIEFNLFTLSEEDFKLLYLCLGFENVKNNIPKKLKDESLSQEELITKQLYKDYSLFKRELFQNLCELNPQFEPLELFKKSQKLLDRFLFLFFAEDRNLLPPNSVRVILKQWKQLKELDAYTPLYDRFKKYFGYLNTGFKGKQYDVFPYNGGLFKPDEVLDTIQIDDDLLYQHSFKLSDYDFESEVDVNILGHIFENSLNEIDEITAQLEGKTIDRADTKRKKDGVFYTPKYITKYIVENTIGKLCEEKKAELDITDEAYQPAKQRSRKRLDNLSIYRDWLLQLTICDPACGSGAFLNQALDFLIKEHRYIDELSAKYNKDAFVLSDVEKSILENNLFGVDLNEESVEIAKLSLWLRTAQPNRKLNDLSDNIKCGNSLIDDVSVAGDSAFNWQKEFPQIFDKGGFDVIIGNPPYGIFIDNASQGYFEEHFPLTNYKINLYILFIERMLQVFNRGVVQFIIPKSLLFNSYYKLIREELLLKTQINEIFTITEKVFDDAEVGGSLIINFTITNEVKLNQEIRLAEANKINDFISTIGLIESNQRQDFFLSIPNFEISIIDQKAGSILDKLLKLKPLRSYYNLKNGLNPGNIKHILISNEKGTPNHKPIIWGKDISKYLIKWSNDYINYDENIGDTISLDDVKSKQGMKKQNRIDFALRNPELFENKKILIRKTGDKLIASLDSKNFYFDTLVHGIYKKENGLNLECLLPIINSKSATIFYRILHDIQGKVFAKISLDNLGSFPIPEMSKVDVERLTILANSQTENITLLDEMSTKVHRTLQREFEQLAKLSKKLENWFELTYADFLKELKKKKIELSLSQKAEWEDYFLAEQKLALEIQNKITSTDKEIDAMVYELYGLSEEEIGIVENS